MTHPAHIEDVLDAISWLQKAYAFKERYLIVGHSCGATLAFQAVMGQWHGRSLAWSESFGMPLAVVGVEGIYDLVALRNSHRHAHIYQAFLKGAFGTNECDWKKASPIGWDFRKSWRDGKLTVLAWSNEDELVEEEQFLNMFESLKMTESGPRRDIKVGLRGNHDEIWEKGSQLADAIKTALNTMVEIMKEL